MATTISVLLINPIIEQHLHLFQSYAEVCTEVKGVYDYFMKNVKVDIVKNPTFNSDSPNAKRTLYFVNYIQHDFKDLHRRRLLKSEDPELFLNKSIYQETQFVKRLQLKKLWKHTNPDGSSYLSDQDKTAIWNMLKQLWFLCQMPMILPTDLLSNLEKIVLENRDIMHQAQSVYTAKINELSGKCKHIIHSLNRKHYNHIITWINKLFFGKNTPLFDMMPQKYLGVGRAFHNIAKDEDYKNIVLNQFMPVMDNIKLKAQAKGIMNHDAKEIEVEEVNSDDETYEFNDSSGTGSGGTTSESDEDYKTVDHIVNLLLKLLEKNQASFQKLYENPMELFTALDVTNIGKLAKNINKDIVEID